MFQLYCLLTSGFSEKLEREEDRRRKNKRKYMEGQPEEKEKGFKKASEMMF